MIVTYKQSLSGKYESTKWQKLGLMNCDEWLVLLITDSLTISQEIKILQDPPADQCTSNPPVSVKGSEVYIFRGELPENEGI